MSAGNEPNIRDLVARLYREESARVLATLIRLLRDYDLAEEALHDAFVAASTQWTPETIPKNPRAWLVSAGRFRTIDRLRKQSRLNAARNELLADIESQAVTPPMEDDDHIPDDRLRLVFICCHPAIPVDAQIAMTLREVCGLRTEEIAHAFLTSPPTVAQRIVRAKAKIRDAKLPFEAPAPDTFHERMGAILHVIYLVFNEGYAATFGDTPIRTDLTAEAIRLARLVVDLAPSSETIGLLALMLLNDSRRAARVSADGDIVLLDDQDRALWNKDEIAEGSALAERALATGRGPYALQAAIAAVHARATTPGQTDWTEIIARYDELLKLMPSPVVRLNRAVAVGMHGDPASGLAAIDALIEDGTLAAYHLAHASRGEMCRRLGKPDESRRALETALSLCTQAAERRLLERKLRDLTT